MDRKTLILVRHAKSCWKDDSLKDIDRPLNKRGRRDAPEMGRRLSVQSIVPQIMVPSQAVRALRTAEAIASQVNYPVARIIVDEAIYGASAEDILEAVESFSDTVRVAMIIGHNPTVTQLANRFSDQVIENVPTCGVLRVTAANWEDFTFDAQLQNFDYPKNPTSV